MSDRPEAGFRNWGMLNCVADEVPHIRAILFEEREATCVPSEGNATKKTGLDGSAEGPRLTRYPKFKLSCRQGLIQ